MSVDISHKKIIKNDNDIIVFEKILWGIFFTSGGIFFIVFIEELLFNLFLSIFVFTGISLIFDENETINFDRRFQKIYLKSRRLFLEKGKERTIKFSEILYPSIKEDGGDGLSAPLWDIILTLKSGESKRFSLADNNETKDIGIRIAKTIGVNCRHIDEKEKSTLLYEAKKLP